MDADPQLRPINSNISAPISGKSSPQPGQTQQPSINTPSSKPRFINEVTILVLISGIFSLLSVLPVLILGIVGKSLPILFVALVNVIMGIGLITVFFGLREMKKWGLYAFTGIIVLGTLGLTIGLITSPIAQNINGLLSLGLEVIFLTYLWRFSDRFGENEGTVSNRGGLQKRILFKILNIIYGLYFFLFANFIFWLSLLGVFIINNLDRTLFGAIWNLIYGPIYIFVSVLFFTGKNKRYIVGLICLFIYWFEAQIFRFFVLTNHMLDRTDLSNIFLYGIPFTILLISMYFDNVNTNKSTSKVLSDLDKNTNLPTQPQKQV